MMIKSHVVMYRVLTVGYIICVPGTGLLPGPISELHATTVTNTSVTLQWEAPTDGSNVTDYVVHYQQLDNTSLHETFLKPGRVSNDRMPVWGFYSHSWELSSSWTWCTASLCEWFPLMQSNSPPSFLKIKRTTCPQEWRQHTALKIWEPLTQQRSVTSQIQEFLFTECLLEKRRFNKNFSSFSLKLVENFWLTVSNSALNIIWSYSVVHCNILVCRINSCLKVFLISSFLHVATDGEWHKSGNF